MNINAEINYNWNVAWEGMYEPKPKVNRLLKSMIEKNVKEMNMLFSQGAKLSACNESTLERVLFFILDSYPVVKCLVDHGFTALNFKNEFSVHECTDDRGYGWDLMARAWFLGAYDVVELLAQNGFKGIAFNYRRKVYYLTTVAFIKEDIKLAKIMIENGYDRREFEEKIEKFSNNALSNFLIENPIIKRKTVSLSNYLYGDYPKPILKKANIFNRKKVEKYNKYLLEDYDDFISMQNKFINCIGRETWNYIKNKKIRDAEELSEAMQAVLNI